VEEPIVSLVIAAFNAQPFIGPCLESVLSQTYRRLEVIIVDDGSTDGTPAAVRCFGDALKYVWQPNSGGCSSPRNHGTRLAKGWFVTYFDADDVMCPDKIERQVGFMTEHPAVAAVVSNYRNFDENGPHPASHFETCPRLMATLGDREAAVLGPDEATLILPDENFSSACSTLFRRDAVLEVGAFDERLFASEDFVLNYRVASRAPIGVLRHIGFLRRLHEGNMSWQSERILNFKIASRLELLREEQRPRQRRKLRNNLAALHRGLALAQSVRGSNECWRPLWQSLFDAGAPSSAWARTAAKVMINRLKGSTGVP
jgi:glycosyltransferase involved in cell wall biosynthesis